MDMLIYRLNILIKGLKTIKEEMLESGLVEFRGVSIDHLINRAIVARNSAKEMRRFIPDDFGGGVNDDEE